MNEVVSAGGDAGIQFQPGWDVLDLITSASSDGITIQDAKGAIVYANDAASRMCGFTSGAELVEAPPEEIVRAFELLDESGATLPLDELPGRRALRGEGEAERVVRFRLRSSGEERWSIVRATPLLDDQGRVRNVVNVFNDVTADRLSRQVQRFLAEATRELVQSIDWEPTLQKVAQLAVPVLADWCSVDILQPDGSLALTALAHTDPTKVGWARELRQRFPIDPDSDTGPANVARTGLPEVIQVTPAVIEAADISDPELLEIVDRLDLSSIMYVPLTARNRTIGVLTLVWAESGGRYTEDDVALAQDLASRAALAIDNATLYRERDDTARALQERLLPSRLPTIPGMETAARYLPADDALVAGGDFYDLFEMDDGSWKAVIGDVCGKGPEAAALMGFVRFTMRAVSRQDRKPSEALVKLNRALGEELDEGSGVFCTAAVVRIRPYETGARLTVAVAGHPLPLIVRADGTVEQCGSPGTLLGPFDEIEVADRIADLAPGDAVVMITDGVLEATDDPAWETDGVRRLLESCAGLPATAIADRIQISVAAVRHRRIDDVAILVVAAQSGSA